MLLLMAQRCATAASWCSLHDVTCTLAFAGNCGVDVSPDAIPEHVLPAATDEITCVKNGCCLFKLSLFYMQCFVLAGAVRSVYFEPTSSF